MNSILWGVRECVCMRVFMHRELSTSTYHSNANQRTRQAKEEQGG